MLNYQRLWSKCVVLNSSGWYCWFGSETMIPSGDLQFWWVFLKAGEHAQFLLDVCNLDPRPSRSKSETWRYPPCLPCTCFDCWSFPKVQCVVTILWVSNPSDLRYPAHLLIFRWLVYFARGNTFRTCIRLSSQGQGVYPYHSLQNPRQGHSIQSWLLKTWIPTSWILIIPNECLIVSHPPTNHAATRSTARNFQKSSHVHPIFPGGWNGKSLRNMGSFPFLGTFIIYKS